MESLQRDCSSDQHRCRLKAASVCEGRLHLEIVNPNEASRGLIEAAKAVSAEVCELCGGRGNPVGDGNGRLLGCRCEGCRAAGMARLERKWLAPTGKRHGLDTPTERLGEMGPSMANRTDPGCARFSNWSGTRDWEGLALLMTARDDERAMESWTSNPGWAGLVRALFATLQVEQIERVADADPALPRLPFMKEKYGQLQIDLDHFTEYLWGVESFFEELSGRICMHCGMPGEYRDREWVRTECDVCSAITDKIGRRRF